MVVDLAVADGQDGAILVADGLIAGRKVDDGEALDTEPDAGAAVHAAAVRAAMLKGGRHALGQIT